jgi:hypothetical protein
MSTYPSAFLDAINPAPLAATARSSTTAAQCQFRAERWRQFWDHWKAQPQQLAGIEQLREAVMAADPQILTEAAV